MFVYMGHGAGEEFVRARALARQGPSGPLAACILMGCSSGRLANEPGAYDAHGPVLSYLLAGELHGVPARPVCVGVAACARAMDMLSCVHQADWCLMRRGSCSCGQPVGRHRQGHRSLCQGAAEPVGCTAARAQPAAGPSQYVGAGCQPERCRWSQQSCLQAAALDWGCPCLLWPSVQRHWHSAKTSSCLSSSS